MELFIKWYMVFWSLLMVKAYYDAIVGEKKGYNYIFKGICGVLIATNLFVCYKLYNCVILFN